MTKLVVFELKDDVDLGWVVNLLADKTTRLAVVGSAPGIFSSPSETSATSSPPEVLSSAIKRELSSGASNATTSQEVKPVIAPVPYKRPRKETSKDSQNAVEDSKEDHLMETSFRDESYVEEEEFVDVEFVDAADTPDNHTPESKSLPKKRKRRLMTRQEFFYSTPKNSSENKENTVFCKLCQSEMTVRSSYGRSRLREHVLRHLNIYTAKCGLCGVKGALREQIRHHHKNKHAGEERICIDLERPADFKERYTDLWKTCFPDTKVMVISKLTKKASPDDKTDSDTACGAVPSATDSKSIIAHMENLLGQVEKSLQIKQEPSEESEMKPFVGHLHEEAEELYEEAEDPYAGYTSC